MYVITHAYLTSILEAVWAESKTIVELWIVYMQGKTYPRQLKSQTEHREEKKARNWGVESCFWIVDDIVCETASP